MTAPDGLPPLREVIAALGLTAKKSLGQNFILDLNLTRRIARASGPLGEVTIIEVGPGPGGLTRALLMEGAARVMAIERDARCLPALDVIAARYPGRLDVIGADALEVDYRSIASGGARVVANLPYGIATELIARWIEAEPWPPWYDRLVVMIQREVAERIAAEPGTKAFGRLSVLCQWRARVRPLLQLPPEAFTPRPRVESTLLELVPRPDPEDAGSLKTLTTVAAAAFSQRRKMLRSSLKGLGGDTARLLAAAGIEPTLRAEQLSVSDFCTLARQYREAGGKAAG